MFRLTRPKSGVCRARLKIGPCSTYVSPVLEPSFNSLHRNRVRFERARLMFQLFWPKVGLWQRFDQILVCSDFPGLLSACFYFLDQISICLDFLDSTKKLGFDRPSSDMFRLSRPKFSRSENSKFWGFKTRLLNPAMISFLFVRKNSI